VQRQRLAHLQSTSPAPAVGKRDTAQLRVLQQSGHRDSAWPPEATHDDKHFDLLEQEDFGVAPSTKHDLSRGAQNVEADSLHSDGLRFASPVTVHGTSTIADTTKQDTNATIRALLKQHKLA
jgi:hypothetical protein